MRRPQNIRSLSIEEVVRCRISKMIWSSRVGIQGCTKIEYDGAAQSPVVSHWNTHSLGPSVQTLGSTPSVIGSFGVCSRPVCVSCWTVDWRHFLLIDYANASAVGRHLFGPCFRLSSLALSPWTAPSLPLSDGFSEVPPLSFFLTSISFRLVSLAMSL